MRGAHGELGAEQLRHRRLLAERLPVLREPGGVVHQVLAGLDLRGHVRRAGTATPWKLGDRLAELLPHASRTAAPARTRPSAMPNESAAMPMRPASSVRMKLTNPCPSSPSRFSAGTSTSSKISSRGVRRAPAELVLLLAGAEARAWPAATARGRCRAPRAFCRSVVGFVRMKELMPFVPFDGSVTAVTTKISPTPPCVMNRFDAVERRSGRSCARRSSACRRHRCPRSARSVRSRRAPCRWRAAARSAASARRCRSARSARCRASCARRW